MLLNYVSRLQKYILQHEKISVIDIIRIGGDNSLLAIIISLAALNVILAPFVVAPLIVGLPLTFLSLCYLFNIRISKLKLPFFSRPFSCVAWRQPVKTLLPYVKKFEKFSKPRWDQVFHFDNHIIPGICLTLLSIVLFLPIPFANTPSAIGIILVAMGVMQKDGLFILFGYGVVLIQLIIFLLLRYLWLLL